MLHHRNWTEPPSYMIRLDARQIQGKLPAAKLLEQFPYLAPRMVYLLQRMENWTPRTFGDLFIPAYNARMDWWVSMFAIFFGIMSIVGLAFGAVQTYLAQRQLAVALIALRGLSNDQNSTSIKPVSTSL